MKSILFFISAFIVVSVNAQITVDKSSMPEANDTFEYVTTQPTALTAQVQKTGANKTWVFKLSDSLTNSSMEYKSSLKTPYAFYFFNTVGLKISDNIGVGQYSMEDVYQFFSNTSSSYKVEGLGFKISLSPAPLAGNYSDEDELFHFPLTYGRRDSSTFKVKISIPLVGSYQQSGYRVSEVVGHGKAILNTDTFECLMLKSYVSSADTINTPLGKYGFPTERIEYKWVTDARKGVLAEVIGTEVLGNFVPSQSRFMYFPTRTSSGGGNGGGPGTAVYVPEEDPWVIYPNPTQGIINMNNTAAKAELFNLDGRLLDTRYDVQTLNFDLQPGVYLLRLSDESGRSILKKLFIK